MKSEMYGATPNYGNLLNNNSSRLISDPKESSFPCPSGQRDNNHSNKDPPFYQLGPQRDHAPECPFYNYTLPDTFPYSPLKNTEPQYWYWYYPFDFRQNLHALTL